MHTDPERIAADTAMMATSTFSKAVLATIAVTVCPDIKVRVISISYIDDVC